MQDLKSQIKNYTPYDEREASDRRLILQCLNNFSDTLTRENQICHFTASCWVVNHERTKALMLFHNINQMWMWPGGHADGESDLVKVAQRELSEETSLASAHLVDNDIFSLEIFSVPPHIRHNQFVSAHLHLNLSYLFQADESEAFKVKPDENSTIRWMALGDINVAAKDGSMPSHYQKLIDKTSKINYNI